MASDAIPSSGLNRRSVVLGGAATLAFGAGIVLGSSGMLSAQPAPLRMRHSIAELTVSDDSFSGALQRYADALDLLRGGNPDVWERLKFHHIQYCGLEALQEVHFNWRFLMWHRAFLLSYERVLNEVSNNNVAIPYWDWYHPSRTFPTAFRRRPLYHRNRYIGETFDNPNLPAAPNRKIDFLRDLGNENESFQYAQARAFSTETDTSGASFFGGPAVPDADDAGRLRPIAGTGFFNAHGGAHNYVGGYQNGTALGDMADLLTSASDPAFYSHHANVDRMIELWKATHGWDRARFDSEAPKEWASQEFIIDLGPNRRFGYRAIDLVDPRSAVDLDGVGLGYDYNPPSRGSESQQGARIAQADAVTAGGSALSGERSIVAFPDIGIRPFESTATTTFATVRSGTAATGDGSASGLALPSEWSVNRSGTPTLSFVAHFPARIRAIEISVLLRESASGGNSAEELRIGAINSIPVPGDDRQIDASYTIPIDPATFERILGAEAISFSARSAALGEDETLTLTNIELVN